MDGLKIVLGEQMEGTENLVIFEIKRPCSLEIPLEGDDVRCLDDEFLGRADLSELLVVLRSRDSRCPPRSAPVVVVRVRIHVRRMVLCAIKEL